VVVNGGDGDDDGGVGKIDSHGIIFDSLPNYQISAYSLKSLFVAVLIIGWWEQLSSKCS